jgi:hypothetical protein
MRQSKICQGGGGSHRREVGVPPVQTLEVVRPQLLPRHVHVSKHAENLRHDLRRRLASGAPKHQGRSHLVHFSAQRYTRFGGIRSVTQLLSGVTEVSEVPENGSG